MSTANQTKRVTLIPGDGIGPEVTDAARKIVAATGVKIEWELAEAGAAVFEKGLKSGVPKETIESLERTRLALKGPLETPVGFGEKSANVTLRKLFELFANVRPTIELPGIQGPYSGRKINFVVVRENVEDLYAGIEHMQTPGVAQCLKLMSRKGCEKIVRLAFELARAEGRKTVHCATKSNIMKLTEGLLKQSFEDVATEYPDINAQHVIIDNCAHLMVRWPEQFEVIVTSNMNGDIISDLAAGLTGGLGLAPSANIGTEAAMFEAVHGSAPTIAGKNIANPTAMILSTVMLLRHLGEFEAAAKIEHAIVITLEEGRTLTCDLIDPDHAAGTTEFTDAVIANLGRQWDQWQIPEYKPIKLPRVDSRPDFVQCQERYTCGVDIFIESTLSAEALGESLEQLAEGTPMRLKMISNRGTMRYPGGIGVTDPVDHWRCRFVTRDGHNLVDGDVIALLQHIANHHDWMHIEKLQSFDGADGFTKAQGED
jgi:isocitrate dehydrogenase